MPFLLRLLAALWVAFSAVTAAHAQIQLRTIPNDAERGYLQLVRENLVTIDGTEVLLAPGATIRNRQNLIIVPTTLPREGAIAEFTKTPDGRLFRVWLLTPEEEARERKPKPR